MSKSSSPVASKKSPVHTPAGSSTSPNGTATVNGGSASSTRKASARSNTSTSSTTASTLGPGPRRFRGDVPAFNPSNSSPHLYTQQMHQYAPQPPGSSPVYPAQYPQYFSQQPQFMPYGGSMMPYYPVMGYPDYSMYQPYQYYSMPPGQFQNTSAYMSLNNMGNGAGNGYPSHRKKQFKAHHSHNYSHNNHHNNNISQSSSHNPYSKNSSASTQSLTEPQEKAESADVRAAEVSNSESVPRIENSPNSTTTHTVDISFSNGKAASHPQPLQCDSAYEAAPETTEDKQVERHDSKSETSSPDDVATKAEPTSSPKVEETELPLLFNVTLEELIEGKQMTLELSKRLLEYKLKHIQALIDDDIGNDLLIDSKRIFQIIDHSNGSRCEEELGGTFPESFNKTNNNDTNDSSTVKPVLNWASLLQSTAKKSKRGKSSVTPNGGIPSRSLPPATSTIPTSTDRYQSLGLLVMSMLYDPAFNLNSCEPFKLKPRGLTNTGNICYMNAVLQCLLFCPPFNKLLRLVEEKSLGLLGKATLTPVLDATINFMNDFANVSCATKPSGNPLNSDGIVVGLPLSPEILYMKLVEIPKFQHLKWGQQEDAEEFLVYLLDGLHEDFVKAEAAVSSEQMEQLAHLYGQKVDSSHAEDLKIRMKYATRLVKNTSNKTNEDKGDSDDEKSESGWSEVGGRRKVSTKRVSEIEPSPITSIFGGRFRSILTVPKSKESHSITVDPYRCISLDISSNDVETIGDALWKLNEVEKLPYKNEDGVEVVAQKQTYIEELPEVLTLQLKRFSFQHKDEQPLTNGADVKENGFSHFNGVGTIEKVLKNVSYGLDLTVPLECLSPAASNVQNRSYSLTGVIYHHGRNAEGGHYTCDVLRGDKKWLRIDDTAVEQIDASAVTEKPEAKDKSAYIFIYHRKASNI